MVFGIPLSWKPPSSELQKTSTNNSNGCFNYDPKYHHATGVPKEEREANDAVLRADGFHLNRDRILLGSGDHTFRRAKSALQSWKHFGLDWAFVDPETKVEKGVNFCVCTKMFQLLPWVVMPLQIGYVKDTTFDNRKGSFSFGSGTLCGHLLAGEERFSVEWDDDDQVWYEVFSFSKPAHFLTALGYPLIKSKQKDFAMQSTRAFRKHVIGKEYST